MVDRPDTSGLRLALPLAALLCCGSSGCAASDYYAEDRDADRTDYVNRLECPGDRLPVCFERGGEIVNCRCLHDSELGKVLW